MIQAAIQNGWLDADKVIKLLDFGAVVEYTEAPGNEILLHVSELAWERTENVSDVVKMGDVFEVELTESKDFYVLASQDGCISGIREIVRANIFEIRNEYAPLWIM